MSTVLIVVLSIAFVVIGAGGGALLAGARRSRPQPPADWRADAPLSGGARPGPAAAKQPAPPRPVEAAGHAGTLEAPLEVEPRVEEVPAGPAVLERPRFRDRLGKARALLGTQLAGLRGRPKLDQEAWDELEEALVLADVGIVTTHALLDDMRARVKQDGLSEPSQMVGALREALVSRLDGETELHRAAEGSTTVWLFVGVNGVGKTTTIGKVAMREMTAGVPVVVAAGDTFRAAAAEQLELWSKRSGAGFVRGKEGGDPGAVVFDAVQHATARGAGLVLADTAGRLHTKVNLMEELKKVRRVADRPPGSVTEVLLVIDATTGQNGLVQARQFTEAVGVTGVVLTKLDGTAKGGIAVAIAGELGIPIKLVGLGEGPEDLVPFDAREFVDALLPDET